VSESCVRFFSVVGRELIKGQRPSEITWSSLTKEGDGEEKASFSFKIRLRKKGISLLEERIYSFPIHFLCGLRIRLYSFSKVGISMLQLLELFGLSKHKIV